MTKVFFLGVLSIVFSTLIAEELNREEVVQKSQESIFESKLVCDEVLNAGPFQNCKLELFHDDKPVEQAEVYIDGGMPAHSHGLPTSPKVVWIANTNLYEIQGLKFSMPGKWLLKFKVKIEDGELADQINIAVDVD